MIANNRNLLLCVVIFSTLATATTFVLFLGDRGRRAELERLSRRVEALEEKARSPALLEVLDRFEFSEHRLSEALRLLSERTAFLEHQIEEIEGALDPKEDAGIPSIPAPGTPPSAGH